MLHTIAEIEAPCGTEVKISEKIYSEWRKELIIKVKPAQIASYNERRSWHIAKTFETPESVRTFIERFSDIEDQVQACDELNRRSREENWDRTRQIAENRNRNIPNVSLSHNGIPDIFVFSVYLFGYIEDPVGVYREITAVLESVL